MAEVDDDPFAHTRMTLGEHLEELRKRVFRGVLALAICFGIGFRNGDMVSCRIAVPGCRTAVSWASAR